MWQALTKICIYSLLIFCLFNFPVPCLAAGTWEYRINEDDTPDVIDKQNTTAYIDTEKNEIRLPSAGANTIAFWPGEDGKETPMDYAVLTADGVKHYSFNGSEMVENEIASVDLTALDPIGLACGFSYPDTIVATGDGKLQYYSLTGSGMSENPALEVAGLNNILSFGVMQGSVSVLTSDGIQSYSFTGSGMTENTMLQPAAVLENPIAVALFPDTYDMAILERDRIRVFSFTGSGLIENPALAITGLENPKAISINGKDIAVLDGKHVKYYSFDGAKMVYNTNMSTTTGLNEPSSIALRPGSMDRVVTDGNKVRYFQFTGSGFVENEMLSVTVQNLIAGGNSYLESAVVKSLAFNPSELTDRVGVKAWVMVPPKTSITWEVTADGENWSPVWRVRGDAGGVLEVYENDQWTVIGSPADAEPDSTLRGLWTDVVPGTAVSWRATLATEDKEVTPIIRVPDGMTPGVDVAIWWGASAKPVIEPKPDTPVPPGQWCRVTTPLFKWSFTDIDEGDYQTGVQLQVRAKDTAGEDGYVYDSGFVETMDHQFQLPTNHDSDGPLWKSGVYEFQWRVRSYDSYNQPSEWTDWLPFKVLALERLRVVDIVNPPEWWMNRGMEPPVLADTATHYFVWPGYPGIPPAEPDLPRAKAGAKVTFMVDGVGPLNELEARGEYTNIAGDTYPLKVKTPVLAVSQGENKRWLIEAWTDANVTMVPEGTLVKLEPMGLTDTSIVNSFAALPRVSTLENGVTALDWGETVPAYIINGSMYDSWLVVNHGRKVEE